VVLARVLGGNRAADTGGEAQALSGFQPFLPDEHFDACMPDILGFLRSVK